MRIFPALLFAAFVPFTASAAIIVANTAAQSGAGGQTGTSLLLGAQFTSPTAGTTITSVNLPLEQGQGTPNVALSLFSDVAGLPGSSLAALGSQTVNGHQTYTFTPAAGVPLLASTPYWLVLSCANCFPSGATAGITNNWDTSTGVTVAGLAGANAATGLAVSVDSGATWGIFQNGPTSPARAFIFQVNGTPDAGVPEPSTFAMIGIGVVTALLARRRLQ